uniref:Innexin n=1 Tax=Setaria digitata TaxID=48799 RepID=A0A915Q2I4_9BILA
MDIVRSLLRAIKPLPDGDSSDRINYCFSTTILVVLSAFISGWSFVGSPIQCWFPAYYRGWWIEYALDYCFIQNTYFIPFTDVVPNNYWDIAEHVIPIPKNITQREDRLIGYYQWVPFILAIQAILFYLPVIVWRTLYATIGIKVGVICDTCDIRSNMVTRDRLRNIEKVASFLTYEQNIHSSLDGRINRHLSSGRFLITSYLFMKFLYALNAVLQFWIIKKLLGVESIWWGAQVFDDLIHGLEWPQTGNFPRVTLCDFSVRVLGNLHRHTVQCVLMINMFNEKIFLFLWFWLLIISTISVLSFLQWLVLSVTSNAGREMIGVYLEKIDPTTAHTSRRRAIIDEFVAEKLRPDGIFLIQLVKANSGDIVTCELISTLWQSFITNRINPPPYTEPLLSGKKKISSDETGL